MRANVALLKILKLKPPGVIPSFMVTCSMKPSRWLQIDLFGLLRARTGHLARGEEQNGDKAEKEQKWQLED